MSSTNFHTLKSLHDSLIINVTKYISFNVYNQAIIHPLNVEQIMEQILILLAKKKKKNEGVPKYFLKGRQIKILKLLYKKKKSA